MKVTLIHSLQYDYSAEVWLEPHQIYLHPKPSANVKVCSHQLSITPNPDFVTTNLDTTDNIQHVAFFTQTCQKLSIRSISELEITHYNPYSFIYFPFETSKMPFLYPQDLQPSLQPFLSRQDITTLIDQTARHLAASANWNTNVFLSEVNSFVHELSYETDNHSNAQHPEITLINRKGNTDDYLALFIALCRSMGIAARYVKGYYIGDLANQKIAFHTWVQVYLPGGGWRGYDPIHNCLVSHRHIAIQSVQQQQQLMLVKGFFRGKATSELSSELSYTVTEE